MQTESAEPFEVIETGGDRILDGREVEKHNSEESAWVVIDGEVCLFPCFGESQSESADFYRYSVTQFLGSHVSC